MNDQLQSLIKALEAGQYNAAPSTLTQGSALQREDLSPVMEVVTFEDKAIKLQKEISVKDAKTTLVQFNRKLDYGIFGSSAQFEVGIGEEDVATVVRATVPMSYYSTVKRTGVAANMVETFNGTKMYDEQEKDAATKIAADVEFDLFRGQDDFSNAGVFDGHPGAIARVPNMVGIGAQIRMSDAQSNTQDLMFSEYGSDQSVILNAGGALTQSLLEDAGVKSTMNHGAADVLYVDPIALSAYNKIAFAKERIMLAGSAQDNSGANLRKQWTSNQMISLEASRFLSGKTSPARSRSGSPAAPATVTPSAAGNAASVLVAGTYTYKVTAVNERGESVATASAAQASLANQAISLSIAAVSGAKYFNVYRSADGGNAAGAKFIGKVRANSAGATSFVDLGHKSPGFVTGYLLQKDTFNIAQLSGFAKQELAITDLSLPAAYYRFLAVCGKQPRKNVLIDNINGQLQ